MTPQRNFIIKTLISSDSPIRAAQHYQNRGATLAANRRLANVMEQMFWIAGEKATRSEMNETKVQYVQGLLRTDYTRGVRPRCLCKTPGVEMAVRKLPSRYILARMPESGEHHHSDCDAFNLSSQNSGRGGYQESAIVIDPGGTTRIKLDVSLAQRPERLAAKPVREVERPPSSNKRRSSTTLLGVLHHAWQEVGLNKWHSKMRGKRGWWTVHKVVGDYAESVVVNRLTLAEILHIPEPFDRERRQEQRERFQDFMRRIASTKNGTQHFGMILAEVATCSRTPYGGRVDLKHLKEFPLWAGPHVFEDLTHRFPRAVQCLARPERTDRVVGLFVAYSGKKNLQFHIRTAALMTVTQHWIPTDSSYESTIADALVQADRRFIKPLRYDAAQEDVFPDFLLLDAGGSPLPMEIYGFTGNVEYERRKHEKIALYERGGKPYWHWDIVVAGDGVGAWPTFPAPARENVLL